ncbi:D-isomer specific 2-hydroxyacid dehydrogenase NAD-binding [Penicillium canariense]|uniref:D-isomer specific 2-hydroxyacid dehydrogenase NAD-binding n=1 Tax=Penicillium canariense TaxID=189055 RepID=A0A9W9LII6_9EURO|nr:D-isomer specific 2-hydroxyacid dehydrogenase NAD-binding [Penicillium canariense]KAJ5157303.1 D-isomer specific 2-hydroxyacid dehydrogenase NAD-binding [Penicillium canariense]
MYSHSSSTVPSSTERVSVVEDEARFLLDEAALVDALKKGQRSATGLDMHFDEPHVNRELG